MSARYGDIGRPVVLFEAYKDWRAERQAQIASGELEEAHTKADFAEFLYGPISTSLYDGYNRVMGQYAKYGRIENLSNFQPRRIKGLRGIHGMGYVGDAGEYPEGNRGDRPSATLMVDTYGMVYGITRQAVINDDTQELLKSNPEEIGYAASTFVTEAVLAYIESNPTAPDGTAVYDASRGNAATAALSEDSLATAISAMENQVDQDGRQITVRAQTLAVQNVRMELIANRIIRSQETGGSQTIASAAGAGSNVMDKGTMNPVNGILPSNGVVRDPYWSDANNWYLFAGPNDLPAFAIGFLGGRQEPQVFLKNPEARSILGGGGEDPYSWEWDSVDYKVRTDFGMNTVDPAGTYRSVVA